ncbi:hypothetical protein IJ596_00490 [bacterium]|nr:hypothetical protein [bacterium]
MRYANRYLGSPEIFASMAKTHEQIILTSCERNDAAGSVDISEFFFLVRFSFCFKTKRKMNKQYS